MWTVWPSADIHIDKYGVHRKGRALKNDRIWFYAWKIPGVFSSSAPTTDLFFRSRVFFLVWIELKESPWQNSAGRFRRAIVWILHHPP